MKICVRQVRGNSGSDVWAENLCNGIASSGHQCSVDLKSQLYQFFPYLPIWSEDQNDADIIQSNTWNGFAFKDEGVPLVVAEHHIVHDPAYDPYRTIPQKLYHSWIFHCERKSIDVADSVICVSRYTQKKIEDVFGFSDSHVIYNGIDTSVFKPLDPINTNWNIPSGKTILFYAGNLSPRKGADLLSPIMKQLGDQYVLLLATGQRDLADLHGKNIINLGRLSVHDLVKAYNRCDIFLSPSRLEGFGLSIAEAMSCGKPVVATNGSSLPELVVDEKGGLLCRMDDVVDFAEKIRYISEDENLRLEMGAFNHIRVEDLFTLEKMVNGYLNLYQSLVH